MKKIKIIGMFIAIVGLVSLYAGQSHDEKNVQKESVIEKNELLPSDTRMVEKKIQLFMYDGCPYCVKVSAFLTQYNLLDKVEFIDAGISEHRALLRSISGKTQAPYLVDLDAGINMPESLDIIVYLTKKFNIVQNVMQPIAVEIVPFITSVEINGLKKYDSATFLSNVQASIKPVVILVSTTWCPPCQQFKPIFQSVAQQMSEQCEFIMLDGDLNQEIITQLKVRSYPTVICYKNGQQINPTNYRTKVGLLEMVSQLL
jgi:thiol-disulfide isomerase/thioredoxin